MSICPVKQNMKKLFWKKKKKVVYTEELCKMCFNIFFSLFLVHLNITALLGNYFSLWSKKLEESKEWALWDMKQQNDDISNPATTWSDKNQPKHKSPVGQAVPAAQPGSPGWWTLPVLFFNFHCLCFILLKRQCQRQLKVPARGEWPLVLEWPSVLRKVLRMKRKRRENFAKDLEPKAQGKTPGQNR